MSGLQEAFYIIAIVFMAVMFILIVVLVAAVFVIRAKINRIQHSIESKIHSVTLIAEKSGGLAAAATGGLVRKARRALSKK